MTEMTVAEKTKAQRRWKLLARALTNCDLAEDCEISVRKFGSFGLLKAELLQNLSEPEATWYEYSNTIDDKTYSALVRKFNKSFTANELIGFNNTGNVCVWPSEECLAFYLLRNRQICQDRRVLELGGGMSCLAGIFAAKYCKPSEVTLTDGNVASVDNVRSIVIRNNMTDFVRCAVVQWAKSAALLRKRGSSNRNKV